MAKEVPYPYLIGNGMRPTDSFARVGSTAASLEVCSNDPICFDYEPLRRPMNAHSTALRVTGASEKAGGRHDHLAWKGKAAALADHEDEHGEKAVARDEIADGGGQTVWTAAALTALNGRVRTCWLSIMISKL